MRLPKILVIIGLTTTPTVIARPTEETAVEYAMTVMQHAPQALSNLHSTPICGQMCLFEPTYKDTFAPKCLHYSGPERFACFCRSHAYQYKLDRCFKRQCSKDERRTVLLPLYFSMLICRPRT